MISSAAIATFLAGLAAVRASISSAAAQTNAAARKASLKNDVPYGQRTEAPPRTTESNSARRGERAERQCGAMEPDHRQGGCGRRREHRHTADENHPRQSLRAWHSPDPHHRSEGAAGQVMRHGQDRGERTVRRVRLAIDADLAEEHRLRADDLAVDDHGLTDFRRLRHGQIAGVDQVLGLEVNLELIGNAERIPGRGQRVQRMKEDEEADSGARSCPWRSAAVPSASFIGRYAARHERNPR